MASASTFKRSNSNNNSKVALLCKDSGKSTESSGGGYAAESSTQEASLQRDLEALSVSKRLVRSVSQNLKKKSRNRGNGDGEEATGRPFPSGCLSLYGKGGGCRVGACEEFDFGKRKSSAVEDCIPHRAVSTAEEVEVECFSYGLSERFCKKNLRKAKEIEQHPSSSTAGISLPDDVLEMCLVRLPLTSLMTARLVCKKWRCLTTTPHFMQMRGQGSYRSPWVFLFGVTRDRHHGGDIHALDVSLDRWHSISDDILKGRFMFSAASIGTDLYVVGGRSILDNSSMLLEKSPSKIHKEVLVFNPSTGLWRKAAPMKWARSGPILGVLQLSSGCNVFQSKSDPQERLRLKNRIGGVSDVYEDPHRFSLRRQLGDAFNERDDSLESKSKPLKFVRQEKNNQLRYALIAVGGHGPWAEPLDSGEIYDPVTNRWMEIERLPGDFGAVCSGTVCAGMFYVYSEANKLAGYDIERGFWVTIQPSHPPPCLREYYPKLVSCKNRLFMLCVSWCERDGELNRREKAVRKLWELDLAVHTWIEVSRHPDAPMDRNAAFVADGDNIYGVEMFKIFGQMLNFLTVCHVTNTEMKWSRISRKHVANEANTTLSMRKSMVVLHL